MVMFSTKSSSSSSSSFTKRSNNNSSGDGWGTGFLLVLFPEEDESNSNSSSPSSLKKTTTTTTLLPPLSSPSTPTTTRHRRLIYKTQSTLSICGLLVFTTFLLFTLSTFEPAASIRSRSYTTSTTTPRRRILHSTPTTLTTRISNYFLPRRNSRPHTVVTPPPAALQGMGTLHRRGTRAMSDLIVAHVSEEVDVLTLRYFLRIVHNSGVLSRSDLVFLFPSSSLTSKFSDIITDENDSFLHLISTADTSTPTTNETTSSTTTTTTTPTLPAGLGRYLTKSSDKSKEPKEPIWGKKRGTGRSTTEVNSTTTTNSYEPIVGPSYGSVVSFEASELDPENTLSGFINKPPIGLRRWACYQMLLGRIRRKYKHMALTDVNDIVILTDPFTKIRNRATESVFLWTQNSPEIGKQHGGSKKGSSHHSHSHGHKEQQSKEVTAGGMISSGIVVGGSRGVRKLSEAVLTEIVRSVMSGGGGGSKMKKKGGKGTAVTESIILNQLLRGGRVMRNVELVVNEGETIAEVTEVAVGLSTGRGLGGNMVARYGNDNTSNKGNLGSGIGLISGIIVRGICCLSELQWDVYKDCLATDQ